LTDHAGRRRGKREFLMLKSDRKSRDERRATPSVIGVLTNQVFLGEAAAATPDRRMRISQIDLGYVNDGRV
jgi:hypothetical protein